MALLLFIFLLASSFISSGCMPITNDGLSPDFLKNENETLRLLLAESKQTGFPFEGAWEKSQLSTFYTEFQKHEGFQSKDLNQVYRLPEILNMAEIRILISYCYKDPPFFEHLNRDLRTGGTKYSKATEILKDTIQKLKTHQTGTDQGLPKELFRNEPDFLFENYQKLLNNSEKGVLKQFTSSSRSYEKAKNFTGGPGRMIIRFQDPRQGADVDDFSIFDEFEVLLPVSGIYTVKKAEIDSNNNFDVVLSGPEFSRTSTIVINNLLYIFSFYFVKLLI